MKPEDVPAEWVSALIEELEKQDGYFCTIAEAVGEDGWHHPAGDDFVCVDVDGMRLRPILARLAEVIRKG